MGLNVRIYNIISNGNYTVRYKSGNNPYPVETDSTFTLLGSYTPSTTEITISGLTFDTQYWIKMTDNTTGRYIVQNIYTHDSKAFPCYDTICFSIDVTCESQPTPTPTVTTSQTVTPTRTPTLTPTFNPTATPTVTITRTPTLTPTVTITRTPTLTPTITRTVTPTPGPLSMLGKTTPDSLDSSTACSSYLTIRPYIAAPGKTLSSLINGDIIYDTYPTSPTNGNDKWVALTIGGTGLKRAFQISSIGEILDTYNCP